MSGHHKFIGLGERFVAVIAAFIAISQAIAGDWAMGIAASLSILLILLLGIRFRNRFLGLDSLVQDEIRKLYGLGRYRQVLRWGRSVSRALWVSGSYEARRAIGELMIKSAERLGAAAIDEHVKALVDDCGWTAIEMGDLDAGEKHVHQGLELATKHGKQQMAAKAMRHIAGKHLRSRNYSEAEKWIRAAREATSALPTGREKDELSAELHYARAVLSLAKGELEKAEKEISISEKLYLKISNNEWQAKIKIRIGEVSFLKGDLHLAKVNFSEAHAIASEHDYRRMVIKSGLWIVRCALKESNLDFARQNLLALRNIVDTCEMGHERADFAALSSELADASRRV